MSTTPTIPIDLAPTPGFCIKSTIVNPAHDTILGQSTPPGRKVFVNICYDNNVPPPPPADEHTIRRAMNPQQDDDGAYYVPVVVSQPRQDVDKGRFFSLIFFILFCTLVLLPSKRPHGDVDFITCRLASMSLLTDPTSTHAAIRDQNLFGNILPSSEYFPAIANT